jgi:hypothetical protein
VVRGQQHVLPADTFEIRERVFKPFLGKSKIAAKAALKYLLVVCLWSHTLLIHFVKNVLKLRQRNLRGALHVSGKYFLLFFCFIRSTEGFTGEVTHVIMRILTRASICG